MYSPDAHWQALSVTQRRQFLGGIPAAMASLSSLGVEVLALACAEQGMAQASDHRYLGLARYAGVRRAAGRHTLQRLAWLFRPCESRR